MKQILLSQFNLESLIFRRALRTAIVVSVCILLSHGFNISQGYWITMTGMLIVRDTVGATLRRSTQRFFGTVLGVTAASFLLLHIHHEHTIMLLLLLSLFATFYFHPFNNLINYGLIVIPLSLVVVFMLALANPGHFNMDLLRYRIINTALGASIGIAASFFLLPNKAKQILIAGKENMRKQLGDYFVAIINLLLNQKGATETALTKMTLVEQGLLNDRQLYLERSYETHLNQTLRRKNKIFLIASEKMAQALFAMHHTARYPLATDLLALQSKYLQQFCDMMPSLLMDEHQTAFESAQKLLATMQQQLTAYAKEQNASLATWRYLAPVASILFDLKEFLNALEHLRKKP